MITTEEILILKDILIGNYLKDLSLMIGFRSKNQTDKIDNDIWNKIQNDVVEVYLKNIQNPKYNKLRRKIELKNAKLGFIVPQHKLVARDLTYYKIGANEQKVNLQIQKQEYIIRNQSILIKEHNINKQSVSNDNDIKNKIFSVLKLKKDEKEILNSSLKSIKSILRNRYNNISDHQKIKKLKDFSSIYSFIINKEQEILHKQKEILQYKEKLKVNPYIQKVFSFLAFPKEQRLKYVNNIESVKKIIINKYKDVDVVNEIKSLKDFSSIYSFIINNRQKRKKNRAKEKRKNNRDNVKKREKNPSIMTTSSITCTLIPIGGKTK